MNDAHDGSILRIQVPLKTRAVLGDVPGRSDRIQTSPPVVIAGVGGSGTRLVAKLLMEAGFFMGVDLNHAYDNLWFSLLFKRPKWFSRHPKSGHIFTGLKIFQKAMIQRFYPSLRDLFFIISALTELPYAGSRTPDWKRVAKRVMASCRMVFHERVDMSRYIGWGWKEPNSYIFIEHLDRFFQNMRFIHVIRNGLDMAYSKNQQQLFNWGYLFDVNVPEDGTQLPRASLAFWSKANSRTIGYAKTHIDGRFLLVQHDQLCLSPRSEIERIFKFLEIDLNDRQLSDLSALPKPPKSMGRYRSHGLEIFDPGDIQTVKDLGFAVE